MGLERIPDHNLDGVDIGGGADGTTYDPPLRSIYVTGAGDVALVTAKGTALTITLPANYVFGEVAIQEVKATGTTATGIFGFRD